MQTNVYYLLSDDTLVCGKFEKYLKEPINLDVNNYMQL
jgi:hypothetical protein